MKGNENYEESEGGPSSAVLLGSLVIAVLCLCLLIIPLLIGKVDVSENENKFVREQMQQLVDQRLAEEIPITMKKNVLENGGYVPPMLSASAPAAPDQLIDSVYKESKELNHARELRWHGKIEEAIHLLESYVVKHPNVVVARIELAYCYLKTKQLRKARLACIAGLMANPSDQEKKLLWQIIERCPKG